MEKNSFSLFETILSLIILSILVSGFLQFTYVKKEKNISINAIKNTLLLKQPHENISISLSSYSLNDSYILLQAGNTLTHYIYNDEHLRLEYIFMPFVSKEIAFKEFQ